MKKKLALLPLLLLVGACSSIHTTSKVQQNRPLEVVANSAIMPPTQSEVITELNFARMKPQEYAKILEERRQYYTGRMYYPPDGQTPIYTKEGVVALNEAIQFLKWNSPVPALEIAQGLRLSAADHVEDQGPKGGFGHYGTNGSKPSERMRRYGIWDVLAAENISYGAVTARDIVIQMLVDDGVFDRGHRKTLFNPRLKYVGMAFGSHKTYGYMCVTDFAVTYKDKPNINISKD